MIINVETLLVFISLLYFAESVSFQCDFGNIILFHDESYTCSAFVEQTDNETILTNVQGAHQDDLTNDDVLALGVSHQIFNVLPRNLGTFFPNLEAIAVHDCTLTTVTADDLVFENLMYFSAWRNRLASLDGNLFQNNPRLRIIDFDTNAIGLVGPNLLAHLSELTEADFRNNRCINTFARSTEEIQALNDLLPIRCSDTRGLVFNCTFTYSLWGWVSGRVYTCNADVFGRDHVLLEVNGEHLEGRSNADVRGLNIRSQYYERVSSNITAFFPDLHVLVIDNCNLLTISAADLEPFPNLLQFGAWRNFLESLESNLFMHNPLLRYVDFDENILERVGVNLLGNLTFIEAADFSRNPCINVLATSPSTVQSLNVILPIQCPGLSDVVFECDFSISYWITPHDYACDANETFLTQFGRNTVLTSVLGEHLEDKANFDVTALIIQNQVYDQLTTNIATFFPNLEILVIYDCTLMTITAADLKPFPNLQYFRVWRNRLESIDGNIFMHNPLLTYIDFDSNLIEIVGENLLQDLTQLEAVDFSRNPCIDVFAGTPEAIQALNDVLPIRCSDAPGVVFDCIFTDTYWGWMNGSVYECDAIVNQFSDLHVLRDVFGNHLEGRSNDDVRALNIQSQKYNQLTREISAYFPNLEVLAIYDCTLMTILTVDLQPFPNLVILRVLSNFLKSLDGNLFTHNPLLKHIDFNNNLLEEVGENLLGSLTVLEVADFSQNPCIDIYAESQQAIQELNDILPIQCPVVHGVVFNCRFHVTYWISPDDYSCQANVTQFGQDYTLLDVLGDHVEGKSNSDVTALDIRGQVYDQLTKDIAKFFPYLEILTMFDCTLKTISAADLQQFPNLIFFRAWMNHLRTLDGNLFMYNPMLASIDFDQNSIESVGFNLLGNLTELESADFRRNLCIDVNAANRQAIIQLNDLLPIRCPFVREVVFDCHFSISYWISPNDYACNVNLTFLTHSGQQSVLLDVLGEHLEDKNNSDVTALIIQNQIYEQLSNNVVAFFPNLEVLVIYNCNLMTIIATDLEPFPNLQYFRVWRNHLESIDGNLFMHNPLLTYIDFDSNLIEIVGENLLQELTALEAVDFSRNPCIDVFAGTPEAIQALNDILPIKCSDNPGLVFECSFTDTYWAYVNGSVYECDATVTQFGDQTFIRNVFGDHLEDRSIFDVRGLNIQNQVYNQISSNIAEFFLDLEVLVIYNCNLMTISAADLEPFPNLVFFRVWRNLLRSIEGNLFMHNPLLAYIDFDTNLIENVGFNLLGNLTNLQTIDFNRNPCVDVSASNPQTIQELNEMLPIMCPWFEV